MRLCLLYGLDTISTGNITGNPYQSGFPEAVWRMISVPLNLNNPEVGQVLSSFGPPGDEAWKLFDNEGNDVSSSASFIPGKAFWLKQILGQGAREIKLASGNSVTLEGGKIILLEGWNQIGNPYAFSVDWNNHTNGSENPNIKGPIRWDGTKYIGPGQTMGTDTSLTELLPWEGYFIYNSSNTTQLLEINPNKNLGITKPLAKSRDQNALDWFVNIRAKIGEFEDIYNYIGTAADAESGEDRYDMPEFPVIGKYISVYFPDLDSFDNRKYSTIDIRPTAENGHSWDMEIISNIHDKSIQLDWDRSNMPEEMHIKILDISHNKVLSLQENSYVYHNRFRNHPVKFRVFTGIESYVNAALDQARSQIPNRFELHQNYPNPFNGITKIRFSLNQTSKISLAVYNILGQKVRTLNSGQIFDTGIYELDWDVKNDAGLGVASGIYFAILRSENRTARIKMILIQ